MQFKLPKNKEEVVNKSFQEWLEIKEICNNKVTLDNGKSLFLIKVLPVNFKLKSQLEQNAILSSYKDFLKNLNSKIQIIISSKRTNIYDHINKVIKFTNENPKLQEMSEDYINLIKQMVSEKGSITKEFYIVIEETPNSINDELRIIEGIRACGNDAYRIDDNEIYELIRNFTNKRIESLI